MVSAATKCELNGAVAAASPNETNQYETTDGHNNDSNLDFFGHHFDPTNSQNLMLNRPLPSFTTSHHLDGHENTPPPGIGHEHRPNGVAMANLTQKAEQQRPKWAYIGQSQSRPTRSTTANRYEMEEALKAKNEAENSSQSGQQSSSANSEADNDTTQYDSDSDSDRDDDSDSSDSSTEALVEMHQNQLIRKRKKTQLIRKRKKTQLIRKRKKTQLIRKRKKTQLIRKRKKM
uniref:DUF1713 domain-containing protein n=1 Tax=Globodera pallida TaxID=36090 RepID=A0A183BZY9_GLOPA